MKAGTGAHGLGHLAHAQRLDGVDKQRWVAVGAAQTELAAVVAVGGRQLFDQGFKFFTGADARQHLLRLGLRLCHLRRARVLGQRHQQVRQVDFLRHRVGIGGLACGQGVFHFRVAHAHTALDLALVQAAEHNLVAQLGTKGGLRHAALLQRLAKLGQVHLVLRRQVGFGLVDGAGIGAQTHVAGHLQLGTLVDQALEHAAAQLGGGR